MKNWKMSMIWLNVTSEAGEYKSISLRVALLLAWLYNWAKPLDLFGPQSSQKRKGGMHWIRLDDLQFAFWF